MELGPILSIGVKAVDTAVGAAQKHIEKARELGQEDVRACRHYLDAASQCIHGLEDGYDELLVNAESCLDWPQHIPVVRRQINNYLEVHQLRRRLKAATEGLEPIKTAMEQRARTIWQWPWRRRDKQAAVEEFAQRLGELTTYFANLENHDLSSRPAGTGVAVQPLDEIYNQLGVIQDSYLRGSDSSQNIPIEAKTQLIELVQKAREDHSKDGLEPITGRINATIEELRHAFT